MNLIPPDIALRGESFQQPKLIGLFSQSDTGSGVGEGMVVGGGLVLELVGLFDGTELVGLV